MCAGTVQLLAADATPTTTTATSTATTPRDAVVPIMSGSSINGTLSPYFLPVSHHHCQDHHANLSAAPTSPLPVSTAGEGEEEEDTDFGAVMYITAVLVFYSLGIVVMIIKYLKTERKEMEEEMALENFFKGIPSKRLEHERDAVNRVAIQAFHTLTSGAGRQDQNLVAAQAEKSALGDASDPNVDDYKQRQAGSPNPDDSDSSGGDRNQSPSPLQRERSKYLPRVSLMFRDSRCGDRRKMQDSIRRQSGRPRLEDSLPPGRGSPRLTASYHKAENGQAGVSFDIPGEYPEHSDSAAASRADSRTVSSENASRESRRRDSGKFRNEDYASQGAGVTFEDEKRLSGRHGNSGRRRGGQSRSGGRPRGMPENRAKGSKSSRGHLSASPTSRDLPVPNDAGRCGSRDSANGAAGGPVNCLSRLTASSFEFPRDCIGSPTKVLADGGNRVDHVTVIASTNPDTVMSPKRLLVSDV